MKNELDALPLDDLTAAGDSTDTANGWAKAGDGISSEEKKHIEHMYVCT